MMFHPVLSKDRLPLFYDSNSGLHLFTLTQDSAKYCIESFFVTDLKTP